MSTALTKAARLKPDIRLAQAVSEFQKDLTDAQKAAFSRGQAKALDSPPSITDVMHLTAEINQRNNGHIHCLGPRFTNFLQGVQQFAALGDVIIGGSQNIIACSVWSLVRLSIFAVVNSTTYFERLSSLFMEIGCSAPRFQSIAMLYPHVRHLQDHLHEYFIEVVRLFHDIMQRSKQSALRNLASSLNDSGLNSYKSRLGYWANTIRDDVNSAMAKNIEDERGQSSRFRASLLRFTDRQASIDRHWQRLRILDACSTYDHQTAWKQNRKAGTTTYFQALSEYHVWKTNPASGTLMYTGILGSGKTVLLANMVDDLNLYVESVNRPVTYFFCHSDDHDSLQARTIIGSLARQILSTMDPDVVQTGPMDIAVDLLDAEGILRLLQINLTPESTIYCIIDGLDECSPPERDDVTTILNRLQAAFKVHVCYSLRSQPDIPTELQYDKGIDNYAVSIPTDNPEIGNFIKLELERCLETGKLTLGDPTVIIDILEALTQGSQGMFLWAALQIEVLCSMQTDDAIRQALARLPRSLSETFSRILQMYQGAQADYQQKLLELICVAYRPLTTDELREALCVVPGDTTWNPAKLINDISTVIRCCGPLITVDEEEGTVRFVHFSVKQYLESAPESPNKGTFGDQAERAMGEVVITYLCYDVFGTQLSRVEKSSNALQSVPSTVIGSLFGSATTKRELALRLLRTRKSSAIDIKKVVEGSSKSSQAGSGFYFHAYVKTYWQRHVRCLIEDGWLFQMLRMHLIRKSAGVSIGTPTHDEVQGHLRGMNEILVEILDEGLSYGAMSRSSQQRLQEAASNGHEAVVRLLLETGKVEADSKNIIGETPLSIAARNGHEAVVRMLLETGKVEADSKSIHGQTPLWIAAGKGHGAVVRLLLDVGGIEADLEDHLNRTPLWIAASNGHEAVVRLLFETGKVEAELKDQFGRTPLWMAASDGHEAVVRLLLETGKVEPDSKNNLNRTPLWAAASNGHETVVRLLLKTGKVEADSKDDYAETPLFQATQYGHKGVMKLLQHEITSQGK